MEALHRLVTRAAKISETEILHRLLNNTGFVQDILDLNRREQLFEKGIDSEGVKLSSIGGGYSTRTIEGDPSKGIIGKKQRGLPYDHITLYDEGDFYDSFQIRKTPTGFVIEADTVKLGTTGAIDLRDRWGDNILGLTEESRAQLVQWIRNEIVPHVVRYLLAA